MIDPPWNFNDSLKMDDVKRGASSNYKTLSMEDIKNLDIKSISDDNCVLALWVPASLLKDGLETVERWGFVQKQIHVWVKTKQNPLSSLIKDILLDLKKLDIEAVKEKINNFNLENILSFGMGRLFRNCFEIALICTKGNIYSSLKNKSQRAVHFYPATKHSTKPEKLQDMLEIMFPDAKNEGKMAELFARREREGWICVGNEIGPKEDIRDSIERLKNL